jgi:hypothetical protein
MHSLTERDSTTEAYQVIKKGADLAKLYEAVSQTRSLVEL